MVLSLLQSALSASDAIAAGQPGQCVHGDSRRGSAGQEPLHGHGVLHHDAAERGFPAVHQSIRRRVTDGRLQVIRRRPAVLPASSLNGAINTLLSNNVLTTQITPDLKSKLSYRYYDFDNNTPELLFADWVMSRL